MLDWGLRPTAGRVVTSLCAVVGAPSVAVMANPRNKGARILMGTPRTERNEQATIATTGGTIRAKFTRRASIVAIALLGTLAAVGVGWGAIPSPDGVIHSCYNANSNPSGQLRVIDADAGAKCAR